VTERDAKSMLPSTEFKLDELVISEERLRAIRMAIYHSSGPGYVIFREFLNQTQAEHLRMMWCAPETIEQFEMFLGKDHFFQGCPNYVAQWADRNIMFFNFLWNPFVDELSRTITIIVQMLRSRITGKPLFDSLHAFSGYSTSCRVILNSNAKVHIDLHRDWYDETARLDKTRFSLSQIQMSLNLSRYGVDYEEGGHLFATNQGNFINIGRDENLGVGDLVIWRANNLHSVVDVRTLPGMFGYLRMIFPCETIHATAPICPPDITPPLLRRFFTATCKVLGSRWI